MWKFCRNAHLPQSFGRITGKLGGISVCYAVTAVCFLRIFSFSFQEYKYAEQVESLLRTKTKYPGSYLCVPVFWPFKWIYGPWRMNIYIRVCLTKCMVRIVILHNASSQTTIITQSIFMTLKHLAGIYWKYFTYVIKSS